METAYKTLHLYWAKGDKRTKSVAFSSTIHIPPTVCLNTVRNSVTVSTYIYIYIYICTHCFHLVWFVSKSTSTNLAWLQRDQRNRNIGLSTFGVVLNFCRDLEHSDPMFFKDTLTYKDVPSKLCVDMNGSTAQMTDLHPEDSHAIFSHDTQAHD